MGFQLIIYMLVNAYIGLYEAFASLSYSCCAKKPQLSHLPYVMGNKALLKDLKTTMILDIALVL